MQPRTDHDLLQEFTAGDREAYAVLVARHEGLVRCACRRQGPSTDLDDCVQAVFLVLARRPRAAARAPALEAWLLRVAWYVCQRARRRQQRRRRAEAAAVQVTETDTGTPPEALEHLDDCLARLPERQRLAVGLHYLGDKPADEVARILGVSRDNAYQLLSRGLAGLRTLLTRRGIVVGETALVVLLAGEAKAATAASLTGTTSLTTALAGSPSASALSLSQGATLAMTLTAIAPAGLAAAFLLPLTVATLALTGEPAPVPVPVVATVPVPVAEPAQDTALNALITIEYKGARLQDIVANLAAITDLNLIVDPRLISKDPGPFSLKMKSARVGDVLRSLAKLTGGAVQSVAGAHFLCARERLSETRPRLVLDGIGASLKQQLNSLITFDFQNQPLDEVQAFLHKITKFNLMVSLNKQQVPNITLRVNNMTLTDTLYWIAILSDSAIIWDHQAFAAVPYETTGVPRLDPTRCDWTGIEGVPGLKERLTQKITLEFKDNKLTEVVELLHQITDVEVTLIPDFSGPAKPINLKANDMDLDNVLYWIANQAGATVKVSGNSLLMIVHPPHS